MDILFRIETDRVSLTWSKGRDKDPATVPSVSPPPGRLLFQKRRSDLIFENSWRASVPDAAATDPDQAAGPRLYEQIDYKLYARAKSGRRVSILHRDPVIRRDLSEEENGNVVHGYINFGSQAG